jgi:hypothetical protein
MSASAILKLQKVGFTTEQVEALADFMDTQSASSLSDLTLWDGPDRIRARFDRFSRIFPR